MTYQRDHLSFFWFLSRLALALVLGLFLAWLTPRPTHAQAGVCSANSDPAPNCGCAAYVALRQFGAKVDGAWPDANSLAAQKYWNDGYIQFKCAPKLTVATSWRYKNEAPQAGDVVIIKSGTTFRLLNGRVSQTAVASGHTGFVFGAAYNNRYKEWEVMVQSANWGCYDNKAWRTTYSDGLCQNVSQVPIYVQNGGGVSFWREITTPKFYAIVPADQTNKKALAPSADLKKKPAVVQIPRDPKSEDQIWVLETLPEKDPLSRTSYVRIVNYKTGKCLDISGGSRDNGAAIIEWSCHNGDNQKWQLVALYGRYVVQSKLTGKVLDVPGGSQNSHVQIIQWEPTGGSNQQWIFEEVQLPSGGCPPRK